MGGYSKDNVRVKVDTLLKLNELYKEGNLNINTFYPYFSIPNLLFGLENDYAYLKKSKTVNQEDPLVIDLYNNLPELSKMIRELTTGVGLENIKYRKSIEDILTKNCYLENYQYAEFVVKAYINDAISYNKAKFLEKYGIDEDTLNYCVSLIQFINPVLYREYLNRFTANNMQKKESDYHAFYSLARRIENGDVSLIEFFKTAPFKDNGPLYIDKIKSFLKYGYALNTISNYLYANCVPRFRYIVKEQEIKVTRTIDGRVLTPEDNSNIFKVMDVYDLPYVKVLYNQVTEEYMKGNYDMAEIDEKYQILQNEETVEIPYQFVKVTKLKRK